jgi:adenosine kinase
MKKYSEVLVSGSMAFDEIMNFPSLFINHLQPDKLHQINVSFVVNKLEKQMGGTGTNIAYNLGLVLKDNVTLLASVGKDGKEFIEFLKSHNVNTSQIIFDKTLFTATGKVITDLNDNQIWGFYYGACETAKTIDIKPLAKKDSLMIISANHPEAFLHFQEQAITNQIDYLYDPGMALSWIQKEDLAEGINHCKYLVGNDYEISYILKWLECSTADLIKKGIVVITTLGEKGVRYQDATQDLALPAYSDTKVEDPTGAGDAWRAGFVGGLIKGFELEKCLKLGNVLASYAIEHYGTVNHNPTEKDIEKRMKSFS